MVTTSRRLGFGNLRQLVGYYCSYQLPYSPVKMAEASQREVVTIKMGHPVLGFQEKVCTWLRAIPNRLCFTALPGTSLRDGHIFFWSTDFKVQSPARYVMRVPFTAQRVDSVPPFQKKRVEVAPISSESVGLLHRAAPPRQQSSVNLLDKQNQANSAKFRNAQGGSTYNIPERSDQWTPSPLARAQLAPPHSTLM